MTSLFARTIVGRARADGEGWIMALARRLGERLAHPRYLYPEELSPHLLRAIGLLDGHPTSRRRRP
jgi:hypothetical protein